MTVMDTIRRTGSRRRLERGQVLPLFALMIVVLMGMAALAIDVSRNYAEVRFDRSAADAASLAGAQDLQTSGTRTVTGPEQTAARLDALETLVRQLGATGPGLCGTGANVAECVLPGTPYKISIKTPAPSCTHSGTSTCDPSHSVQVKVHNPVFETTFARVLGQTTWDVGATSVAGLSWSAKYAVITLQAPAPKNNGTDANIDKNLVVDANGTVLHILSGDAGTNTSARTTNFGLIKIDDGFIDHYDDLSLAGEGWTKPDGVHPIGNQISSKIQDPSYMPPSFVGAPASFANQSAGITPCAGANYPTDPATVLELTTAASGGTQTCYLPGVYTNKFTVANKDVAYLMPGAYSFLGGMVIRGSLFGGLIDAAQGVVLVVPQSQTLDANNALNVLLNTGHFGCAVDTCRAAPARDFTGAQVKTPQGLVLTIEVPRDPDCFVGTDPVDASNVAACTVNTNQTVGLAGGGVMSVGGVIYGPSDNMKVSGGGAQVGYVGQIVSWTVTYAGHATLNQSYPGPLGNGILRIDPACTAPGEPCVP